MISRNLYENSHNPFFPTVDNGGRHESGIIASEFPVFNYLVFIVSIPFGYDHWYGRLINLIISSLAAWYFYKLLKFKFSETIAFNATFLLTVSIWFGFSRKTMPDIFSMSLMLIALYHAFIYLFEEKNKSIWLFGICGSLAILTKLPAIYILSIFALPLVSSQIKYTKKKAITIACIVIVVIADAWYFTWGDYLFRTYGYQLFFPRTLSEGFVELKPFLNLALEQFYFSAFHSFLAFAIFCLGLFFIFKTQSKLAISLFIITFMVFIAFALKTGNVFAHHSYYIIPFVPVMAFIASYGLSQLPKQTIPIILFFITAESLANQHNDFFIKDEERFKLKMEAEINQFVPLKEKIALAGDLGPQYLYFAHRKGWGLSVEQTLDTNYMKDVERHNYKYLVLVKKAFNQYPNYEKLGESKHLIFYRLEKSTLIQE